MSHFLRAGVRSLARAGRCFLVVVALCALLYGVRLLLGTQPTQQAAKIYTQQQALMVNEAMFPQAQNPPKKPPTQPAPAEPPECTIGVGPVQIDICSRLATVISYEFFGPVIDAVVGVYQGGVALVKTDAAATYANRDIDGLQQTMLIATDSFLLLVLLITGIRMIYEQSIISWSDFRETIPQVLIAFLLAQFSLTLTQAMITLNNALCSLLTTTGVQDLVNALFVNLVPGNLFAGFLWFIVAILFIALVIEAAFRIAVLDLCIVLSSFGCFALAWKPTQRFGFLWLNTMLAAAFVQFFQLLCLVIGFVLYQSNLAQENTYVVSLGGIAILFVALYLPTYMFRWAMQPLASGARVATIAAASAIRALL